MNKIILYFTIGFLANPEYSQTVSQNNQNLSSFIVKVNPEEQPGNIPVQANNPAANSPRALVAGVSKGIGFAIAEAMANRGNNLILIARNIDSLIAAKEKLDWL